MTRGLQPVIQSISEESRILSAVDPVMAQLRHNELDGGGTKPANSDLAVAFEQFSSLSAQLSQSYQLLENRVSELTTELGVAADERVTALEDKERLADRLENLLNVLPAGVVVLNAQGCITDCNPAALDMLSQPNIGDEWRVVIQRCFRPQKDDGHEVSTYDGRKIQIVTRSLEEQGQIILLTDNSETRRLQNELNRQERLNSMGKMVSALAHQIRTPLSAATLYAGHLCNAELPVNKQQQFSRKLVSRLHHLERQVSDMLLFARGEVSLNDHVTVAILQRNLYEAIEASVQEKHISCRISNQIPEAKIRCNLDVLVGALSNLVNNAIQATMSNRDSVKPELHIEFEQINGNTLCIAVNDNGPGIKQAELENVQEAFVTTKAQGIGLGLAVVKVVASAHRGEFKLLARATGGVSARMFFPLSGSPAGMTKT